MSDSIVKQNIEKILGDITESKEQSVLLQVIIQLCSCNALINWQKVCNNLPENIYIFLQKALISTSPINNNLLRWKKVDSTPCTLCKTNNQTQTHMLNNCPAAVRSGRYKWHCNSILYRICHYLSEFEKTGFKLYGDLIGFKIPIKLFKRLIPDIVLVRNNKLAIL